MGKFRNHTLALLVRTSSNLSILLYKTYFVLLDDYGSRRIDERLLFEVVERQQQLQHFGNETIPRLAEILAHRSFFISNDRRSKVEQVRFN